MKKLVRKPGRAFGVLLLAALLLFPAVVSQQFTINSFCLVFLYAYWASSWNILGGYTGQMSLGHACFVGLGAYTTAVLFSHFHCSPWIGLLAAGLVAGLASLVIGIPCFKLKGSYFTLSTVALCHVFRIVFNTNSTLFGLETGAAQGMKLPWRGGLAAMQFLDKRSYYYINLGMLLLVLLVSYAIKRSKLGYYLAAIRTNQDAAASLGVNVLGMKLTAMFISAFFTAMGGGLYVKIMVLAVVGGGGTLWGPIVGASLLVPVQQILNSRLGANLAGLALAIYGVVLMIVIYFMPKGFLDTILRWLRKLREKLGKPKEGQVCR